MSIEQFDFALSENEAMFLSFPRYVALRRVVAKQISNKFSQIT